MPRRFVNQLGQQETISEIFLATDKQLRPNRNGNLYLQVELRDRTGMIGARMWNCSEPLFNSFENGDFVLVEGTTQLYQGAIQMIVNRIERVPPEKIDHADFMPLAPQAVDAMARRIGELLRGMKNLHLRNLAECFLLDDDLMQRFRRAPAGVKNHHAYPGGLLEHVANLMEVVVRVVDRYPAVDPDLLLMGAFLHDMGKIHELSYDRGFAYTDEGQLLGHVTIAVSMLDAKCAEAHRLAGEPIPTELVMRLKHMILSHHGEYEFGSPKLPMTLEAVALHQLDNLDAKLHSFEQQMRDDPNGDSNWTLYNQQLGRKLFKGLKNSGAPAADDR
jgi:3'-5' exoribonuclease